MRRLASLLLFTNALVAQTTEPPPTLTIQRATAPITVDGNLSDWEGVPPVELWFETNPGDNTPPAVRNVGYLAYDDAHFYAAFDFFDPKMSDLRAPFGDRDNVPSTTDYGGIIINPSNDRRSAILFLANARGIQYDAVTNDASGEDSAPDFYWEAATRIHPDRWSLEIRIPFASLRYSEQEEQTWGIMLYRNYPRDRRFQHFSTRLPRGGNCFICNSNTLTGLRGLPKAGNLIAAPYVTAKQESFAQEMGSELQSDDAEFDGGLDAKWTPNAVTAVDLTLNPDFSQVESDVAQITANERFAIFFPEKRPFFLEGLDLFSTPFQAAYTRSITSPRWGVRGTGKLGQTAYTALLTDDRGGGSIIIPGPIFSQFADQEFESLNLISRFRRDLGQSFASLLFTDREIDGGGSNRVIGPDFRWAPNERHTLTGQFLWSESETPDRPELAGEWNGQKLSGHAGQLWYFYSTPKVDFYAEYWNLGDEFRADLGFMPQVGYRSSLVDGGYTWRPEGRFFNRIRSNVWLIYQDDQHGQEIFRQVNVGVGMDGRWSSFTRLRLTMDKVWTGVELLDRNRLHYELRASPSRVVNSIGITGFIGEDIDFGTSEVGDGLNMNVFASIRPTDHLELRFDNNFRYLDVPDRLFTAQVERLRATYTFSSKSFLRLVGQHVRTDFPRTDLHDGALTFSALYAYKLNWQTVLFLGVGDDSILDPVNAEFESDARQLFFKISYALQR